MTTTSVAEFGDRVSNRLRVASIAWISVWLAAAAVLAPFVTLPANAQTTRGSISGLVVDESGAAIPGATVTITETATNVRTSAQTEPDGLFLMAGLLPGSYSLRVEASGFEALVRTNLNLTAGQRLAVETLQLKVGSASQTLTVTGGGEVVQLDSSDRGDVVTTTDVEALPMAGRNWASLLNVLPGAITQTNSLEP